MVRDVGREKSINVFLKCQSVTDQFPPCSMDSLSLRVSRTSQSLSPGFEGKVQTIFLDTRQVCHNYVKGHPPGPPHPRRARQQKLVWGGVPAEVWIECGADAVECRWARHGA